MTADWLAAGRVAGYPRGGRPPRYKW